MKLIAFMRTLVAKGMSWADAADMAEQMEEDVAVAVAKAALRSPAAARQAAYRERKRNAERNDVHNAEHNGVDNKRNGPEGAARASHVSAQVVTPSLPSLRSEEVKNPLTPTSLATPAKPKPETRKPKSRMCPAEWAPSPADLEVGRVEGFTPGEIERELAKFRDHEFRDPHSEWSATFRKWLRTAAERKPRKADVQPADRKFAARQANYARAFAGSEMAALRRRPG